jgi:putative transposase
MASDLIIKEHVPLEELNRVIREVEKDVKTLNRLHLIRQIYKTNNVAKACDILDVPVRTGYNWVDKWNKGGIEGLKHKLGAGRKPFLTEEEFQELDKWMEQEEFLETKDVYLYIKDNFGVDYSIRQVERIVNKLNYTWVKPYPIADKQPPDAEELLKEATSEINPDKDIYALMDETAVQNPPNVSRIIKKTGIGFMYQWQIPSKNN